MKNLGMIALLAATVGVGVLGIACGDKPAAHPTNTDGSGTPSSTSTGTGTSTGTSTASTATPPG